MLKWKTTRQIVDELQKRVYNKHEENIKINNLLTKNHALQQKYRNLKQDNFILLGILKDCTLKISQEEQVLNILKRRIYQEFSKS